MRRTAAPLTIWLCLLIVVVVSPARVLGQAAWEYTPYQARVWIAQQAVAQMPNGLIDGVGNALSARVATTWCGVMRLDVAAIPPPLRCRLLNDFDKLTADEVASAANAKDLENDKIYLAAIRCDQGSYSIRVRELDCHSRQLGPVVDRSMATT